MATTKGTELGQLANRTTVDSAATTFVGKVVATNFQGDGSLLTGVSSFDSANVDSDLIGANLPTNPVATNGFFVNSQTVNSDFTITAGFNAFASGPVTINSGVTVTMDSDTRFVIV